MTNAGAIKSLVYVLRTGTETSKQNAACALLSLALLDDNKSSIVVCGAVPLLVSLLVNGSDRGKKDALTTLYKLCSIEQNKERAVRAGAVKPLVGLISEQDAGLAEKAMVVLSSLAAIAEGKEAIVEEGVGFQLLLKPLKMVPSKPRSLLYRPLSNYVLITPATDGCLRGRGEYLLWLRFLKPQVHEPSLRWIM